MIDTIIRLAITQFYQIAIVAGIAAVAATVFGRSRPHLAHMLWMVVLIKALTPPIISSPMSVFGWFNQNSAAEMTTAAPELGLQPIDAVTPTALPQPTSSNELQRSISSVADSTAIRPIVWQAGLVLLWIAGSASLLVAIAISNRRAWARIRSAAIESDNALVASLNALANRLGVRRTPRLVVTDAPIGPLAAGIVRPTIVLPSSLSSGPTEQLEPMLAHELIHLRRHDLFVALLQWVAVSLYWWHPAVWWASRNLSRERERCCDAEVLGSLPFAPQKYAQGLIDTLRLRGKAALRPALTIPLTRPTRQRLEYIMCGGSFPARTPRRNYLIAAVLFILLLPGGALTMTAVSQEAGGINPPPALAIIEGDLPEDFKAPQLVYLAWQKDGVKSTGKPIPHQLWRPDGTLVDQGEADEVLKQAKTFSAHWRQHDQLHPLVVVFKVDPNLKGSAVRPYVFTPQGKLSGMATWLHTEGRPYAVAALAPQKDAMANWPEMVALQIRFPTEDWEVIKTIEDIPDEPVELADNVTWYLDPKRARIHDAGDGKPKQPLEMTAAVLQCPTGEMSEDYDVRVYLRDRSKSDETLSEMYSTNRDVGERTFSIRVSNAFPSKDAIERVEFRRRRFAKARIENVAVRLDLLAQQVGSFDQDQFVLDYGVPRGAVIKRIAPPFPDSRMQYYQTQQSAQAKSIPDGPATMIFRMKAGHPAIAHMSFRNMEDGTKLKRLLPDLIGIEPDRIIANEDLLNTTVTGDFTLREGASRERVAAELEPILTEALQRPIKLRLEQAERDVYVARGKFLLSFEAKVRGTVLLENTLVGTKQFSPQLSRLRGFLESLGKAIGVPIINEVKGVSKDLFNIETRLAKDGKVDPDAIMQSASRQTGLTFTKERRKIETLIVDD